MLGQITRPIIFQQVG